MERIAEITHETRGKSLSLSLNRSGTFSGNLPLSSDWASDVLPMKNCVIVQKNDNIVFSGPLWQVTQNFNDSGIQFSSVGWLEILFKRIVKSQTIFNNIVGGDIALSLLADANSDQDTWINAGTNTDTQPRTITYEIGQNVGEEIQNLSEIESGFDFEVTPDTRELNIKRFDDFNDLTEDVAFGFNWGPKNLASFERIMDADAMQNQVIVQGDSVAYQADEDSYWDDYNMFTELISLTETNNANILQAIANAEVAVNKLPQTLINFTPKAEGLASLPSVLEDYTVGDKVKVVAERNNQVVSQPVRIFGLDINIDENGKEQVSSIKTVFS